MKYSLIPITASLFVFFSCSSLKHRIGLNDDQGAKSKTVPREQYDLLLSKYEELSKKYELLKEKPAGSNDSLVDEIQQGENFSQGTDTETVNLLSTLSVPANQKFTTDIESQLGLYRRGMALKIKNQSEATKIFQQLEAEAITPVKVRAKYQIGEMMMSKGQYDLALQVFEDIINKFSESGIVLDALRGAAQAADKLGIQSKREQYFSMLNDVFGPGQGM